VSRNHAGHCPLSKIEAYVYRLGFEFTLYFGWFVVILLAHVFTVVVFTIDGIGKVRTWNPVNDNLV
jgi:hypothetical protein